MKVVKLIGRTINVSTLWLPFHLKAIIKEEKNF